MTPGPPGDAGPTAAPDPDRAAASLWRDRSFRLFLSARSVAVAGYAVTSVALPLLVFQLSGSAFLTSMVAAIEVAPYLVFGLVAGALADRVDRRRLMLACQATAGAALGSIPVAAALGVVTVAHVLVVAGVLHTAFVWFDAASFGALPALVGRDRLVPANSIYFTTTSVVDVSFPAVGGLLIATVGPAYALGADAIAYLVAGVLIALVPGSLQHERTSRLGASGETDGPGPGLLGRTVSDIREGLAFLWEHRLVRALSLLGFGQSVTGGAVSGLLVVFAVDGVGLGPDDGRVAVVFVAVAAGGLVAALVLPWLTRRLPVGWITIGAYTSNAVLLVALALVPGLVAATCLLLAWSTAAVLAILNGMTTRQRLTPDGLQSRVNTTARMIAWGGAPVGALVGGVVAQVTDVRTAYLVMAVGVATSAVLSWFSPLRHRLPLDQGPVLGARDAHV